MRRNQKVLYKSVFVIIILLSLTTTPVYSDLKSGLTGKVVDGNDKGIEGVTIKATLSNKIITQGYDSFTTTTDVDGKFSFTNLFPFSSYQLEFWHKKWSRKEKEITVSVTTPPHGETFEIEQSIIIEKILNEKSEIINPQTGGKRFIKSINGIISDSLRGIQWYIASNDGMDWNRANQMVIELTTAGGGWRMPSLKELKSLYVQGLGSKNLPSPFQFNGTWVWTKEAVGSSDARGFLFNEGKAFTGLRSNNRGRVFAVRP